MIRSLPLFGVAFGFNIVIVWPTAMLINMNDTDCTKLSNEVTSAFESLKASSRGLTQTDREISYAMWKCWSEKTRLARASESEIESVRIMARKWRTGSI